MEILRQRRESRFSRGLDVEMSELLAVEETGVEL
jgi:hypothetical protein